MAVTDNYSCFGETKLFRFCFNCHTCKKTHCLPPPPHHIQPDWQEKYLPKMQMLRIFRLELLALCGLKGLQDSEGGSLFQGPEGGPLFQKGRGGP